MSKKVTTSCKLFIGMDIHKRSWSLHFCTDLTEGSGKVMPPNAETLKKYVNKYYEGHSVTIAYEAGCCGYSAARDFEFYNWDVYVVNPADIPRPAKNALVKTDKIDAKNIAKQLRAGNLCKLTIPDIERECLRSLTRQRTALTRDLRRIKSRIKSLLLYYNVQIPAQFDNANWSKAFAAWLSALEWNYNTIDATLSSMLSQYNFLNKEVLQVSVQIRGHCRKNYKQDYSLLRSVPGIGPLTAAYVLAELGDIRRFHSFKKFAGYIGLIPGVYSSGDTERTTGVNPRANKRIRSLIVESSWVAIRIDPALQQYYRSHAGKDSKAVIFKVARKLASRMHAVMKTEIPYQIGVLS